MRSSSTASSETPGAPPFPCSCSPTRSGRKATGRAQQLYAESARGSGSAATSIMRSRATRSLRLGVLRGRRRRTRARSLEENLRQATRAHDEYIQGMSLSQLAEIAVEQRRLEDAVSMLTESYRILRELNDLSWWRRRLPALPVSSPPQDEQPPPRAFSRVRRLFSEKIGASPPSFAKINARTLTSIRTQLDEADFAEAWSKAGHSPPTRPSRSPLIPWINRRRHPAVSPSATGGPIC